jgi:hypothetical protein
MNNILHIAPCGMNCSLCLAFQREKNICAGCNATAGHKANHCATCSIKNCEEMPGRGFCYSCTEFPCKRLKQLDKRYRTRYGMSMIANLTMIKTNGIEAFINLEINKWTCKCGSLLCVHRPICLKCGTKNEGFPGIAASN